MQLYNATQTLRFRFSTILDTVCGFWHILLQFYSFCYPPMPPSFILGGLASPALQSQQYNWSFCRRVLLSKKGEGCHSLTIVGKVNHSLALLCLYPWHISNIGPKIIQPFLKLTDIPMYKGYLHCSTFCTYNILDEVYESSFIAEWSSMHNHDDATAWQNFKCYVALRRHKIYPWIKYTTATKQNNCIFKNIKLERFASRSRKPHQLMSDQAIQKVA